jgi:hypothetical protein
MVERGGDREVPWSKFALRAARSNAENRLTMVIQEIKSIVPHE